MRCHRCHSKIDPGRKMCPVCGTLVKKPRGSYKVAREAGGSLAGEVFDKAGGFFQGVIQSINLKMVLAFICGALLIGIVFMTFNCGSCDRSGGFSSCGKYSIGSACSSAGNSISSCASSCSSCVSSCAKRVSCSASGSDVSSGDVSSDDASESVIQENEAAEQKPEEEKTEAKTHPVKDVQVRPRGSSCAGCGAEETEKEYERLYNSPANGREYFYDGKLYYCNSSGIYFTNDREETGLLMEAGSVNSLYIEDGVLYYLMAGNLWKAPLDNVRDTECVIDAASEGASEAVSRVYGFALSDGYLCYWGPEGEDGFVIMSRSLETGKEKRLNRGQCVQQQVYHGSVYYLSREENDFNTLYSVPLQGGKAQELIKLPVTYFTLCNSSVFAYTYIDSEADLYRIDCDTLKIINSWDFVAIRGMNSDDGRVYYYSNNADGSASVCSLKPDGTENRQLFADNTVIQLNHIAGRYFSLYTHIDESADNRLAGARYYIVDVEKGDKKLIK